MNLRRILLALTCLLCGLAAGSACAESPKLPEIKIGIINELTGSAASLGEIYARGIEVAMQTLAPDGRIAGVHIRLVHGDAQDDAKVALSEFQRMSQTDGIHILISPRSKSAMPINPLAERKGIPLVGSVAATRFLETNKYAVRALVPAAMDGEFEAAVAKRLGKQRAAIVGAEDEWASSLTTAIAQSFSGSGQTVVFRESISPQEQDFASIIAKLRATAPDVIFAQLLSRSGLFVRKLREAGVMAQVISSYWIQQPEQIEAAGRDALEGVIFAELDSGGPLFRAAYEKTFPGKAYNSAAYLGRCGS